MRTCSSAALTETVGSVSALRRCALWSTRTVFRTLHSFAFAIDVGSGVRAFLLLLLLLLILWGLLCRLCERWKQYRRERKDRNNTADEVHGNFLFRSSGVVTLRERPKQ